MKVFPATVLYITYLGGVIFSVFDQSSPLITKHFLPEHTMTKKKNRSFGQISSTLASSTSPAYQPAYFLKSRTEISSSSLGSIPIVFLRTKIVSKTLCASIYNIWFKVLQSVTPCSPDLNSER